MIKLSNVNEVQKGNKVFVREITPMWDSEKKEYYNHCFEYVFEVIKNNPNTLGCKYVNGPYKGSSFKWIKGYALLNGKKEYFLVENDNEILDKNYRI